MSSSKNINFEVFDSDPELLSILDVKAIYPLWISVRVTFLRWLTGELFYSESVTPKQTVFEVLKKHNSRRKDLLIDRISCNKKIIIWTTGLGNYIDNGFIYDRLVQKFAAAYPEESLILQPSNWAIGMLPCKFEDTYFCRNLNILQNLSARIETYFGKEMQASIKELIDRFGTLVKLHHDIKMKKIHAETLMKRALLILIQNQKLELSFAEFFRNNEQIRLLLLEEGYYGGRSIPFIIAAKNAGIHVAEFQHGAIFAGHEAYNIGFDTTNQTLYSDLSPDTFLTYGNWWRSQMRLPNKIIDIGNPQRDTFPLRSENQNDRKQILILGDGLETQKYLSLALEIDKVFEFKVVFRPHPLERHKFLEHHDAVSLEIDLSSELSSRLASTDVIISELSTGLFDAMGIVEHIYIWKTNKSEAAFGTLPFASFESVEELREKLSNVALEPPALPSSTDVWTENWLYNYKNFVDPIIR